MKNAFLYFLFCPFLGFINAIKHYRSTWAKPTLIAFVAFFGMSMVNNEAVDGSKYVERLILMHATSVDFDTFKASFFNETEGLPDLYVGIVTYFFSLFTDNGQLLFFFYGFVFGYFYINNIWLVLNETRGELSWLPILLLLTFSFVLGFWTVTGVRMNTASHIFFYGAFLYLYHNQKKGIFIVLSSVLFHFSFVLPLSIFLIYSLVRLNYRFIYLFYLASFFVAELNVEFIRTFLELNLPDFLQPKVKSYLNDEYVETFYDSIGSRNWYVNYYQKLLSYFTFVFMLFILFKVDLTKSVQKLLGFSLLLLAVANITSLLPSGGRFLDVAFLFSIATCFIIITKVKFTIVTKSATILSPLLLLFCIISIRMSFDFFNITTFTNPLVVLFTDINIPLIDLIK